MTRIAPRLAAVLLLCSVQATAQVPYLLLDLVPGPAESMPLGFIDAGDTAIFSTIDSDTFRLWLSDGTIGGTTLIAAMPSFRAKLGLPVQLGGKVWFRAPGGLWSSDGTWPGTGLRVQLADETDELIVSNGLLYTLVNGQIWRSDGKVQGTRPVATLSATGYSIRNLTDVNGRLFFRYVPFSPAYGKPELWTSDGTADGTARIDAAFGADLGGLSDLAGVGDLLFFALGRGYMQPTELWRSDGTSEGTFRLTELGHFGGTITAFGNPPRAWFDRDVDPLNVCLGSELWSSDGTVAGTARAVQISASCPGNPANLTVSGGKLFYEGWDCSGPFLGATTGTQAGTARLASLPWQSSRFRDVEGTLYFSVADPDLGTEPWLSDGTTQGSRAFGDLNPGPEGSYAGDFVRVGNRLLFRATDAAHGSELWAHDLVSPTLPLLRNATLRDPERGDFAAMLPLDALRDAYLPAFVAGSVDPDSGIVGDGLRPLAFYAIGGNGTIRLTRTTDGDLRIRF